MNHDLHDSAGVDAKSRVFATPELLILILQHTEIRTLLHAQRVNRTFQDLITQTPSLQRRLFFTRGRAGDPLPQTSPPTLHTYSESADEAVRDFDPRYVRRVQLNPLLRSAFPPFFPCGEGDDVRATRDGLAGLKLAGSAELRDAFLREGASWRRMLLCDPPPDRAAFQWRTSSMHSGYRRTVDLLLADNNNNNNSSNFKTAINNRTFSTRRTRHEMRMGPLYDLVQEVAVEKGRFVGGGFDVGWRFAGAYTEAEFIREQEDARHHVIPLEVDGGADDFALEAVVWHSYGCISQIGTVLDGFRSQARDVVRFDDLEGAALVIAD